MKASRAGRTCAPAGPLIPTGALTTVEQWSPEREERYQHLNLSCLRLPTTHLYGVELQRSQLARVVLDGVEIEASMFTDCRFDDCSLANVTARGSSLVRVAITSGRLTGLCWTAGGIRDVTFSQCKMNFAVFRLQKFTNVAFVDCDLHDSDFQEADLRGARFERCDLTSAEFSKANLTSAWFRDCAFDRVRGVSAFNGATVGGNDLISLSPAMASAIGIAVQD